MIKKLLFLLIMVSLINSVFADTNGVWHKSEDIRGGVLGSDENSPEFYFTNKVGINTQTPTYDLTINGLASIKKLFDFDDNSYFLNLNENSKLNSADFKTITINGIPLNNIYVNVNQANSISSAMIIDNSITSNDLGENSVGASELINSYQTGSIYDSRFINVGETGDNIADGTIDTTEIQDNTIYGNDLVTSYRTGSAFDTRFINTGETGDSIADGTIDTTEIQDNTIYGNDLVTSYRTGSAYDTRFLNVGEKVSDSDKLDGHDTSYFQREISQSCPSGSSIKQIKNDGTVTCQSATSNIWQKYGTDTYFENEVAIGKTRTSSYKLDVDGDRYGIKGTGDYIAGYFREEDTGAYTYLGYNGYGLYTNSKIRLKDVCDSYGKCIRPKFVCDKKDSINENYKYSTTSSKTASAQIATANGLGTSCGYLTNNNVKALTDIYGSWGKDYNFVWGGKSVSYSTLSKQIAKKLEQIYNAPIKSVKLKDLRQYNDLRHGCKGDTIPYTLWKLEIEFAEACNIINTN